LSVIPDEALHPSVIPAQAGISLYEAMVPVVITRVGFHSWGIPDCSRLPLSGCGQAGMTGKGRDDGFGKGMTLPKTVIPDEAEWNGAKIGNLLILTTQPPLFYYFYYF